MPLRKARQQQHIVNRRGPRVISKSAAQRNVCTQAHRNMCTQTHTGTDTHARMQARTHSCTSCTHARTHARTHACTRARTHTHSLWSDRCNGQLMQYSVQWRSMVDSLCNGRVMVCTGRCISQCNGWCNGPCNDWGVHRPVQRLVKWLKQSI